MEAEAIKIRTDLKIDELDFDEITELFNAVNWPHAEFPDKLRIALANSQELVGAFADNKLVGFANAVGDNAFYSYIHWLIVHPDYQRRGIARKLATTLLERLETSNQVFVIADTKLEKFWKAFGFVILQSESNRELIAAYRSVPRLRSQSI